MIDGLAAITFDFGNTLVAFPPGPMAHVVDGAASAAAAITGSSVEEFRQVWAEERQRQFAEDVPQGREANMDVRAARVLYRLMGGSAPAPGARWDEAEVAGRVAPAHVDALLEAYADNFVRVVEVPPAVGPMLRRISARYPIALISNWPLSLSIERFLRQAGWDACFSAVLISQTVGSIKPRPEIFLAAALELGVPSGPSILHVGDDRGADVVGAQLLGWRTALVRGKPADSTLPVAPPAPEAMPDVEIDSVLDLEPLLGPPAPRACP
jgi:FMN phosphatase YigB (HAD superfamily)